MTIILVGKGSICTFVAAKKFLESFLSCQRDYMGAYCKFWLYQNFVSDIGPPSDPDELFLGQEMRGGNTGPKWGRRIILKDIQRNMTYG